MTATTTATPDVSRIKLFSLLGLESIGWTVVVAHIVAWTVDAIYFIITQVKYMVGYGGKTYRVFYGKWTWDHLPDAVGRVLHIAYLQTPQIDKWWVTPRHDARHLIIGIVTGVVVTFLFTKPLRHRRPVSAWGYTFTIPKALVWAIPGVAMGIGVIYSFPWLAHHGWTIPGNNPLSNEVNGWVSAGHWHLFLLGLLGSQIFAKYASRHPADEAQWFYAERSAAAISRDTGLAGLRGKRVYGPPGFRARVRYVLACGTGSQHSEWAARILVAAAVIALLLAGFGAWLTLAGPAAGA